MKDAFDLNSIPSLKPTVQRNDGENIIFLRTSARITEVEKDTIYANIINLFDDNRTIGDIIEILSKNYSKEEILKSFKEFDDLLLIEKTNIDSNLLTHEEQLRWSRNLNFLGSFCNYGDDKKRLQSIIRDCKVTLLGLGGLGSHILYDLAALGCKDIVAVEFDKVEISNLNRQILYNFDDIGKYKAEVAKDRILKFSPDLKINIINKSITSPSDIKDAIKNRDILICVADRPKTEIMHWVNLACVSEGIPLITGGLDTKKARFYSILPNDGCLQCWRDSVKNNDTKAYEVLEVQQRTQLRGDNAAFVPFVALIAGFIVAELVKIITNIGSISSQNTVRELDFIDLNLETAERWVKNPNCPVCSTKE